MAPATSSNSTMHTKIGITGGIGSGKSYICNCLKELGYPVYNCDDEAKRLMVEDATIIAGIKNLVGDNAYLDGTLNKKAIADFLFRNADNAKAINGIVHPVVKQDFAKWAGMQEARYVFMECAILFESGFQDAVDTTVLIYAPAEIRLHRAMMRDNASAEQIKARMNHQISDEEALSLANYVFDHTEYETTTSEINKLIKYLEQC